MKGIVKSLIQKAESRGEPSVLRARNIELTAELKMLQEENQSRKRETESSRKTIEELKNEIMELKK